MNGQLTFCYLREVPQTPRLRTIPLPPITPNDDTWGPGGVYGDGDDDDDDNEIGGDDFTARDAEKSTSLAAAKPDNTENGTQSGVSLFFYPARDRALY